MDAPDPDAQQVLTDMSAARKVARRRLAAAHGALTKARRCGGSTEQITAAHRKVEAATEAYDRADLQFVTAEQAVLGPVLVQLRAAGLSQPVEEGQQ